MTCSFCVHKTATKTLILHKVTKTFGTMASGMIAKSAIIHSGNIVNWNRLKRKPMQTAAEELVECISVTVNNCLSQCSEEQLQNRDEFSCVHSEFKETLPNDERDTLKLTVKVFICRFHQAENLREAIKKTLSDLDVSYIDTLLLSFPDTDEDDFDLELIKPYWLILESLISLGHVLSVGVSDFSKEQLEALFDWSQTKPGVNQVNLASCCVMPADLTEYAKENDIQLLTHSDPPEMLTDETLQNIFAENFSPESARGWVPSWVIRYSVLIKCRGIITNKGYIVKAFKDM